MDVGTHWHLDDATSIADPTILAMASQISLGAYEGRIYNALKGPEDIISEGRNTLRDYRFEIYDRSRTALTGVIGNGAGTGWADGVDTTDLPMTANAVAILTVGDVVKVENEYVVVKSVDRTGNTIDVWARGAGGTTGAAHTDTTAFTIIGKATHDVDLKNVESFNERTGKYTNYVQTFLETVDQTFTDVNLARKAFEQRPQLFREALDRMFRRLSKTVILGRQQAPTKSPHIPSMTSGILHQLSDGGGERTPLRYNATGVTDPETILKNALITCWDQGGDPDTILINPANKRKYDPLIEQFIRMSRQEARIVGTDNADAYSFQGKVLTFLQDQDYPTDRIGIVKMDRLRKGWVEGDGLRGPVIEPALSSREVRVSFQGTFFVTVTGVGVDHVDVYNASI